MTDKPFALIVDDEWRLARNLVRFVERQGYEARAVASVTEANSAITHRRPDLALVDLKLPDFTGIELCRMLDKRFPGLPMLVMSARIDQEDEAALRDVGVTRFLTKPFSLEELGSMLSTMTVPDGAANDIADCDCHDRARPPARPSALRTTTTRKSPRVVLYSHDTMGLGHMRRNILIARTLAESELRASVLLVSGAREIGRFELPKGIDCLVLPSYEKSTQGNYQSRHLDMVTQDLVNLRAHTINASVSAFNPDVMVADNVPRGALNELDNLLSALNARGHTRCVLGLRDVLDEPQTTREEWAKRKNLNAIQWHYDEVWVYGDPSIYNLCDAYSFGDDFDRKVRFTGYLDARRRATPRSTEIVPPTTEDHLPQTGEPYNLCLVGGGQDGFALAEAFASAHQPTGTIGLLITGPFMQQEQIEILHRIAGQRDDLQILGFVQEPTRLLSNARRVVAMGGYNTVNEVLAFERPTLIVPRVRPRLEQIVRAERLSALGYVDMLHPEALTPSAVTDWLHADQLPPPERPIDLGGLDRLVDFVKRLTSEGHHHATA